MSVATLVIVGAPMPQGRPRHRIVKSYGKAPFGVVYDPPGCKKEKQRIHTIVKNLMREKGYVMFAEHVPLRLDIIFYVPIPTGFSKVKRTKANMALIVPAVKPDLDNYAKLVLDACCGVLYHDDNSVTDLNIKKRYSNHPGTKIQAQPLFEEAPILRQPQRELQLKQNSKIKRQKCLAADAKVW